LNCLARKTSSRQPGVAVSVSLCSKTDIDALVTIALRWTEAGLIPASPDWIRQILTVTSSNADGVGTRLWRANHDMYNFRGPSEMLDASAIAEVRRERGDVLVEMPTYAFGALPGVPRPQTAIALAGNYAYDTDGEHWERRWWPNDQPPFEMLFHQAIVWTAAGLLGIDRPTAPAPYNPEHTPIEDAVMDDPLFQAVLMQRLTDSDRDLFERLADL
jgi:hypothetical protein